LWHKPKPPSKTLLKYDQRMTKPGHPFFYLIAKFNYNI
jgi:hypothetical protein